MADFPVVNVYVTDFPVVKVHIDELYSARIWQHKLCATLSAKVNINYHLPIKVYYRICTVKTYQNRNNSWKPECVWSFNMGWQLFVTFILRLRLGIKYYYYLPIHVKTQNTFCLP